MAISASIVLEVRVTGSDTNSGGFKTGASGTDWSQQDSAQYSVTDGVTAGTTTITSATANFGTDVVGNLIYVQGGTGSVTAGWYEITARTNATTITVDRSTGLTAGTGVTLKIGGGFVTISAALAISVTGNAIYVKASAGFSISAALSVSSSVALIGYTTTRGDGGQATITATAGATSIFSVTTFGVEILNFILDGANISTQCVLSSSTETSVTNCLMKRFATYGFRSTSAGAKCVNSEITAGKAGSTAGISFSAASCSVEGCNVHDNPCGGISLSNYSSVLRNTVTNNTGASSDGIAFSYASLIESNSVYNSGRDGIRLTDSTRYPAGTSVLNNLLDTNGGYGLNIVGASNTYPGIPLLADYNAYRSNTSGARNNVASGTHDVTLSASPFTNAAGGDFSLNSTAGGGAVCRAAGIPGAFPGSLSTGYLDIGAVQHRDAGGLLFQRQMSGGLT